MVRLWQDDLAQILYVLYTFSTFSTTVSSSTFMESFLGKRSSMDPSGAKRSSLLLGRPASDHIRPWYVLLQMMTFDVPWFYKRSSRCEQLMTWRPFIILLQLGDLFPGLGSLLQIFYGWNNFLEGRLSHINEHLSCLEFLVPFFNTSLSQRTSIFRGLLWLEDFSEPFHWLTFCLHSKDRKGLP